MIICRLALKDFSLDLDIKQERSKCGVLSTCGYCCIIQNMSGEETQALLGENASVKILNPAATPCRGFG